MSGEIAEPGGICSYGFSGQEGDLVSISMLGQDDRLDPYVELKDADGNIVVYSDDSAESRSSEIGCYWLPGTGIYSIVARAYGDTTGGFELALTKLPDLDMQGLMQGLMSGEVTWTESQFSRFLTALLCQNTSSIQPVDSITAWFMPDNQVHMSIALKEGELLGGQNIDVAGTVDVVDGKMHINVTEVGANGMVVSGPLTDYVDSYINGLLASPDFGAAAEVETGDGTITIWFATE